MLTTAAIIALLNNPFVQAAGTVAMQGVGYGLNDLHAYAQVELYNRQTAAIQWRGQVLAYYGRYFIVQHHQGKVIATQANIGKALGVKPNGKRRRLIWSISTKRPL